MAQTEGVRILTLFEPEHHALISCVSDCLMPIDQRLGHKRQIERDVDQKPASSGAICSRSDKNDEREREIGRISELVERSVFAQLYDP